MKPSDPAATVEEHAGVEREKEFGHAWLLRHAALDHDFAFLRDDGDFIMSEAAAVHPAANYGAAYV
jgi:hypothetical protein